MCSTHNRYAVSSAVSVEAMMSCNSLTASLRFNGSIEARSFLTSSMVEFDIVALGEK